MSGLSFFVAIGAAFAFNVSSLVTEVPIFREIVTLGGSSIMENITSRCTLNGAAPTCSASGLPSENDLYWNDAGKTTPSGGIPSAVVFEQPTP